MLNRGNTDRIFWLFIFIIIFLQLSTTKNLPILVALLYSTCIVFTLKIPLHYYLKRFIGEYLVENNSQKFVLFTLGICIISAAILTMFGYVIFSWFLADSLFNDFRSDLISTFFGMLSFTILFSGANFAFALLRRKSETEKQEQILKNSLLEMEIDHLRTQLSPHFTFNILNNLHFLIRKDKDAALEMLARYSNILRYYVYESNSKWIKLNDEITFLKHYIELEKGRIPANLQLEFKWNIIQNELLIIPFVLSTFIENAFKHVSNFSNADNFIVMNIYLDTNTLLIFHIRNTFNTSAVSSKNDGVGLKNVTKRLDLFYRNNYTLNINKDRGFYEVKLQIKLSDK